MKRVEAGSFECMKVFGVIWWPRIITKTSGSGSSSRMLNILHYGPILCSNRNGS